LTQNGQTPLVVGVFNDDARAKAAIDALRAAGFGYDQVGVASQASGNTTTNLRGDLTNLGLADDQASYYDNEFQQGRTVVSVRPDGRDDEATNILQSNGAYNYDNQGQVSNYAQSGTANTANTYTDTTTNTNYAQTGTANTYTDNTANTYTDTTANTGYAQGADYANETDDQRALRLREEQLNVSKQPVQTGEVRLGKDVVEEQKTVNVPVTHEEVYIERRPVTDAQVDNTPIGQDETIRVPVSEEQVNVSKNTVVTGEVAVGKRAVQETQQVSDTVRREEARIDQSGNPVVQGADAVSNTVGNTVGNTVDNTLNRDNTYNTADTTDATDTNS
jgi:uncharacterized protein (TIGR02271 family)